MAACTSNPPASPSSPTPPSDSAPQILTLGTNTTTLDERDQLVITAVVTDIDGVDDLIGGDLDDPDTGGTYGAFATSATEGAYQLTLTWSAIDAVRPIDAGVGGGARMFHARFFDQTGNAAEESAMVTLQCSMSGYALCHGECTDLQTDPENCGACGVTVADGTECHGGQPSCAMGPENTAAACSDGCSNDGDPYVDCDDYDCCDVVACAKGTTCNP